MIRWSIAIWLVLIAGAGGSLYHLKYKVEALEHELAAIHGDIEANRDAVAMLHAEWSYLNDPTRIEAYAGHYLSTRPATVHDIVAFDAIPMAPGHVYDASLPAAPDGVTPPPLPPLPPRRTTEPGATPLVGNDGADGMIVADAETAPPPELALVPAGPAQAGVATAAAAPQDAIGALIANVLDSHSASSTDGPPAGLSFPRGIAQ
ncbi:MAG: hypothetical protein R3F55_15440 [Alphaproteobacteria bacterium]